MKSVKIKDTLAVGPPSSLDIGKNEELAIADIETGFFDAMLTFGWLAKRAGKTMNVVEVNHALGYWLTLNHPKLFDKITRRGVDIEEFLQQIVHDDFWKVGPIVKGNLEWITERVEDLVYEKVFSTGEGEWLDDKFEDPFFTTQRTIRFVNNKTEGPLTRVLAGIRVVAPGAIRLKSDNARDRVDLVAACQSARHGDGWRVESYQGLLQQAWLRVKDIIRAGTRTGTVGLVSRNMSHNIGSHALFYLETDEEQKEKQTFFRYLRERMELLAGFATSMPLSSTTGRLSEIIHRFKENEALLERIARSEQVKKIHIEFDEKNEDHEIALPGGVLSAQALYSIFENNIRDSAKHGRTEGSGQAQLTLRVQARTPQDPKFAEDFIELIVSDNRKNYAKAGPQLQEKLAHLRIVDEAGRLESHDWGVKERLISAALLRGRRLEDIEIQIQVGPAKQMIKFGIGDFAPDGEPRILDVRSVGENLAWVFYLLKPKDVLLIGSHFETADREALSKTFGDAININSFEWLNKEIEFPSRVRHRFVVVCVRNQMEVDQLEALRDKLPYRVIVCLPDKVELLGSSWFACISKNDLDLTNLSLGVLYHLWVNWLLDYPPRTPLQKTKRFMSRLIGRATNAGMPAILFDDANFKALTLNESTGMFDWILDRNKGDKTSRPILLFDRHGHCVQNEDVKPENGYAKLAWSPRGKGFSQRVTHYEAYITGSALATLANSAFNHINSESLESQSLASIGFSFLEAGLTKILIADERIDPTSETKMSWSPGMDWECSKKELFKWKGIDIRGEEYARDQIPGPDLLMEWVKEKNYDFLVLHKGIVDKLIKLENRHLETDPQVLMSELFEQLREHVRHVVIHSGRMASGDLPAGVKFMSLSNVDIWLRDNRPKIQIVEDLYLLRRP